MDIFKSISEGKIPEKGSSTSMDLQDPFTPLNDAVQNFMSKYGCTDIDIESSQKDTEHTTPILIEVHNPDLEGFTLFHTAQGYFDEDFQFLGLEQEVAPPSSAEAISIANLNSFFYRAYISLKSNFYDTCSRVIFEHSLLQRGHMIMLRKKQ
jgi:hypothetical protein